MQECNGPALLHSGFQHATHLHAVGGCKYVHAVLLRYLVELNEQLCQQPAGTCIRVAVPGLSQAVNLILQEAKQQHTRYNPAPRQTPARWSAVACCHSAACRLQRGHSPPTSCAGLAVQVQRIAPATQQQGNQSLFVRCCCTSCCWLAQPVAPARAIVCCTTRPAHPPGTVCLAAWCAPGQTPR